MWQFCRSEALVKAANLDRTCLDEWQCSNWVVDLECWTMTVERVMDLGAEFVGIDSHNTLCFAEYARKFEDFAEGTSSILFHPLRAQE